MDESAGVTAVGDVRWDAVVSRDASSDGAFWYAVTSTGIYCRPSCPAKRPNRERVRYFDSPDAAEKAGYRACRRCNPRDATRTEGEAAAAAAARLIEERPEDSLTLAQLAQRVGMSPAHLQRTFTRLFGCSPRAYRTRHRVAALRDRLRDGEPVAEAGYQVGFGSSRGLYHNATKELGMTPASYRAGGAGTTIRYTFAETPLGTAVVGLTERGVCCVLLGDSEEGALAELVREFPRAELVRDDDATRSREVAAAVDAVAGRAVADDEMPPLDLLGTEFQRRVWEELRRVVPGQTVSYAELAGRIGEPRATRAVAGACAGNHVAVIVPCHRVVRTDGGLGGYKWGVERKRELLAREGASTRDDAR